MPYNSMARCMAPPLRLRRGLAGPPMDGRASRMKFWLAIVQLECMIAPEEASHAGLMLIELGETGNVG